MRRKLVSNWQFQTSFGVAMARGVFVGLLLPGLSLILVLYWMSQQPDLLPDQRAILSNELNHFIGLVLLLTSVLAMINGLFGFFISQRFAGPLSRIESWILEYMSKKNPGPLKVRKQDEFGEVASSLNKIISHHSEGEKRQ